MAPEEVILRHGNISHALIHYYDDALYRGELSKLHYNTVRDKLHLCTLAKLEDLLITTERLTYDYHSNRQEAV